MGEKTGNMVIVYAALAVLSVLLMIFYLLLEKKREKHITKSCTKI